MELCLYCAEQLDGVATAAIITRYAKLKGEKTRFCGYLHNETLTKELEQIKPETPTFILDICPHEKHKPQIKKLKIIYWSTHDPNAPQIPAKIFDHTKEKKCSAELAQKRFLPNDQIAKKLAKLAHEMTYWQQGEEATKLSNLIASKINPTQIIQALANGATWSKTFEKKHKEYKQKKEQALKNLIKTLTIKKYLKYNLGYAFASNILTTADAGQKILDTHQGVDVSIILYKNGKIAFRKRNECEINLRKIAQLFDGGGHPYAAGASINKKITKENFEKTINEINSKLKEKY